MNLELTLMEHEADMLGLDFGGDEGFKIDNTHWHVDKLCMTITVARLRQIGPFQIPTPHKVIRISQSWDTGGSRLCPLEEGFYEETNGVNYAGYNATYGSDRHASTS